MLYSVCDLIERKFKNYLSSRVTFTLVWLALEKLLLAIVFLFLFWPTLARLLRSGRKNAVACDDVSISTCQTTDIDERYITSPIRGFDM